MTNRPLTVVIALLLVSLVRGGLAAAPTPVAGPEIAQRYTIDVAFDPEAATLAGEMTVDWSNTTGESQESLPFRLYPNAEHYGEGGIVLESIVVDGAPAAAEGSGDDPTVMRVPFEDEVDPGEGATVELAFTTTIPIDSPGSLGLFRGNSGDGSWALVNWYPIVAGWEPGVGWNLVPPAHGVDPTFVTASAWDVTVAHPATYTLVATGDERADVSGERAVTTISLDPGRELAMTAFPAGDVTSTSVSVDETLVEITLPATHDVPGMRELLEDAAREAVPRYGAWFDYPLDGELDFTTTALDGALGVAWTGAIWLDLEQLTADGELQEVERESLLLVVYHEIAHQWMANVIGADSNDHAFLTEGMAHVLTVAVVRDTQDAESTRRAFTGFVAGPYRAFVNGGQDGIADTPAGPLVPVVHSIVSYGKGGIGFEAIRQQIGDEAFVAALAGIADEYAWGIVTPAAMLEAFEEASGQELDALWSFWFEESGETTVSDVDAVIAGSGE